MRRRKGGGGIPRQKSSGSNSRFRPQIPKCSQSRKFVMLREMAGREGRSKQKERERLCTLECQSCANFVTHMRVGNMAPHARPFALSMRWTLGPDMMPKQRGASLATKVQRRQPRDSSSRNGGSRSHVPEARTDAVSSFGRSDAGGKGPCADGRSRRRVSPAARRSVAEAWTGRSMQAPNKRFVEKEESSEKEHRIRIVNDTKMNWSFVE